MIYNSVEEKSVFAKIRKYFLPPTFADKEKSRRAQLLHFTAWSGFAVLSFVIISRIIFGASLFSPAAIVIEVLAFAILILIFLIQKGYILFSSVFLVFSSWGVMIYQAWAGDGLRDAAVAAQLAIIIICNLLLGWEIGLALAVMSIFSLWGMAILQINGALHPTPDTPLNVARDLTAVFILANLIMYLILRNVRQSISDKIASEERFRKFFHSSAVAICIADLNDGRFIDANQAFWELSGLDPKVSIGKSSVELGTWQGGNNERKQFVHELQEKHSLQNIEYDFTRPNGEVRNTAAFYELIDVDKEACILAMFYDETEKKMAEEALRESESRTRALLHAIPDMIFELDRQGTFLNFIGAKGISPIAPPTNFIGKNIRDLFPDFVWKPTLLGIEQTLLTGETYSFEYDLPSASELHSFEARIVASGVETILGIVRDITSRKQAEADLKHRESILNAVAFSAELFLKKSGWESEIDKVLETLGATLDVSHAYVFENHAGQNGEALTSIRFEWHSEQVESDLTDPAFTNMPLKDQAFEKWYDTLSKGQSASSNVRAYTAGEREFLEPRGIKSLLDVPIFVNGKWWGIIGFDDAVRDRDWPAAEVDALKIAANILGAAIQRQQTDAILNDELSQRKQLISDLEEKNAEAETLRESVAIVASTLERSKAVERILEQLEHVVPYDSASVQLVRNGHLEIVGGRRLTYLSNGQRFLISENDPSYPLLRKQLPYVLHDDIQSSIPRFNDSPTFKDSNMVHAWMAVPLMVNGYVIGIITLDGKHSGQFTKRHAEMAVAYADQVAVALENARLFSNLQDEVTEKQNLIRELEAKNTELEQFTYTVSHDLKSPLITIKGFLGFLKNDAEKGNIERLQKDIQRISDATDKMQALLNELLELSRVGRLMNPPENISFNALVQDAIELTQGQLEAHHIHVDVTDNLPNIYGDRQRLVTVIQNLIDNAAKFMGNQPEPLIKIGQDGIENRKIIFYVRDNGIGIDPKQHERIFGLFNKLDPDSEGTGVGLSLVKRIVEAHGGRIWVESEPGNGATFYFTLPTGPET